MRAVDRKLVIVILILVLFAQSVKAQTSIGIWPAKFEIRTPMFTTNSVYLFLFNPSNNDVNVQIKFNCKNCVQNLRFGENIIEPGISITPSEMTVEKNTSAYEAKNFTLRVSNSPFIKSYLNVGGVLIPYWSLNFGEKEIDGDVEVTTTSTRTFVTITSKGKIILEGIDVFMFSFAVSIIIFVCVLGIYLHYKRMKI